MTQITVRLTDDVVERAQRLAQRSGRLVEDLLAETIELSLRPLGAPSNGERPMADWSDQEVLAGVETELPPAEDARLGKLLDEQQAGSLAPADRAELAQLMESYQSGLLRSAGGARGGETEAAGVSQAVSAERIPDQLAPNPRASRHRIIGKTPCGRATVIALQLNNWIAVMVRREWIAAGWHPPVGA